MLSDQVGGGKEGEGSVLVFYLCGICAEFVKDQQKPAILRHTTQTCLLVLHLCGYVQPMSSLSLMCAGRGVRAISLFYLLQPSELLSDNLITPRAHARARGYVIGRGVYILFVYYILYISLHFFLEPILYLPKYSLSEVCFNTDRLLI